MDDPTNRLPSFFINYVTETRSNTDSALASKFFAGAQAAFTVGRFLGVALMHFFKPRWVFLAYMTGCIIFVAPAITQRENIGMSMLYVTLFFESICFPTIVALGMRGLGRHTKIGSGLIVGGVLGGAVVPPLMGHVIDMHNSTSLAMVVPLCFFVAAWTYPLAVNFIPWYRDVADAFTETEVGMEGHQSHLKDEEKASEQGGLAGPKVADQPGVKTVE
jgi:MFS transporter, FHS family, L-fucose permease